MGLPRKLRDPLLEAAAALRTPGEPLTRAEAASTGEVTELLELYPLRELLTRGEVYGVWVDRPLARFSSWYEMFPRSPAGEARPRSRHLPSAAGRLPRIAAMGFDVVYLPPDPSHRHACFRKGRNNTPRPPPTTWAPLGHRQPTDGGHNAVHPDLGTLDDFDTSWAAAGARAGRRPRLRAQLQPRPPLGQRAPDWFRHRARRHHPLRREPAQEVPGHLSARLRHRDRGGPLGGAARRPPFWIDRGVRVFRVDNPHTKPLAFWEWLIDEIKTADPDVVFLSEAFTRPAVMYGSPSSASRSPTRTSPGAPASGSSPNSG